MEKTVLLTGADGAVASAVVPRFARAGWRLALFGHGPENAERLQRAYPAAHVADVDLTDEARARQAVEEVLGVHGAIDALLNIAGGFAMQAAPEASQKDRRRLFDVNFVTLYNATRAVLPGMIDRHEGFILGVAAAAAQDGAAQAALYAASKAALVAYLKSLDAELEDRGVRCSILYPMGVVDTPANREAMPGADPETWIAPEELAAGMHFLATRSARGHIRELQVFAR